MQSKPENASDIRAIITVLDRLAVGEVATYGTLSTEIRRDVQKCSHLIRSARKALLASGKVFETVPGVGVSRLNDIRIMDRSQRAIRSARRRARRSLDELSAVDYNALASADKLRHCGIAAINQAVAHITKPAALRQVQAHAAAGPLQIGQTFELFSRKD